MSVEPRALRLAADAGRVRQIENRIAGTAEDDTLIGGRQKSAGPVRRPAAGAAARSSARQIPADSRDSLPRP